MDRIINVKIIFGLLLWMVTMCMCSVIQVQAYEVSEEGQVTENCSVKIAVIDTGEENQHGAIIRELIANNTNDSVEILSIEAFDQDGVGTVLDVYLGIKEAMEKDVDVINLSFSGLGESDMLEEVIKEARDEGVVVVSAAGNNGDDVGLYMPANIEGVIAVGALDGEGCIASYSNVGEFVDVMAVGNYVYDDTEFLGTSISAAYITAAVALIIQKDPDVTIEEIENKLYMQTTDTEYAEKSTDEIGVDSEWDGMQVLYIAGYYDDATTFYNSASHGNYGEGIIEYNGDIYWCSRGYIASESSVYRYENLGWYIKMSSASTGESVTFYINKADYLYDEEDSGSYRYQLYKLPRSVLSDAVMNAGYSTADFFAGDVTVVMDGYVRLYNYNTDATLTNGGPYNLQYTSAYNSLISAMQSYSYSSSSQEAVLTMMDKILVIEGANVIPTYDILYFENTTDTVTNMPEDGVKTYGVTYTLSTQIPVREGYTFVEWNMLADGTGTSYQPGWSVNANAKRTLYAQWEIGGTTVQTYDILYFENTTDTVTNMPEDGVKTYGVTYTLSTKIPVREGYVFIEWNMSADGTGTDYQPGWPVNANAKRTLYAQWEEVIDDETSKEEEDIPVLETYTIVFDAGTTDEVSNMPATGIKTYGITYIFPSNVPIREGYIFLYWLDEAYDYVKYPETGKLTDNNDHFFVAVWECGPSLETQDVYMYLEDDIDVDRFYKDVWAMDEEDGDISELVVFNQSELEDELEDLRKIEIQEDVEYKLEICYSVMDSNGNVAQDISILHAYAIYNTNIQNIQSGYIRFISMDYMETLEENSVWRGGIMWEYLKSVLTL